MSSWRPPPPPPPPNRGGAGGGDAGGGQQQQRLGQQQGYLAPSPPQFGAPAPPTPIKPGQSFPPPPPPPPVPRQSPQRVPFPTQASTFRPPPPPPPPPMAPQQHQQKQDPSGIYGQRPQQTFRTPLPDGPPSGGFGVQQQRQQQQQHQLAPPPPPPMTSFSNKPNQSSAAVPPPPNHPHTMIGPPPVPPPLHTSSPSTFQSQQHQQQQPYPPQPPHASRYPVPPPPSARPTFAPQSMPPTPLQHQHPGQGPPGFSSATRIAPNQGTHPNGETSHTTSHQGTPSPGARNNVTASPPLFTRSHSGPTGGILNRPLEVYYPKGMCVNVDYKTSGKVEPPPAADSRFLVIDDGNASPHFIRSTMYAIPTDRNVLRQAVVGNASTGSGNNNEHTLMGVVCTPMALPSSDHAPSFPSGVGNPMGTSDGQETVELPNSGRLGQVPVDFAVNREAPPRCRGCGAYVSPFWSLRKCNFCGSAYNTVGTHLIGMEYGTVEYPVQGPFVTRQPSGPVQPHWVFCIDLTAPGVLEYVDLVIDEIWPAFFRDVVDPQQQTLAKNGKKIVQPRVAMAFCAGSGIYIPQKEFSAVDDAASSSSSCSGFVVMPDVQEEAYCPLPLSEWTWSLPDEYDDLLHVYGTIIRPTLLPRLIQREVHEAHHLSGGRGGYSLSAGGAAMQFLLDSLKESGGRAVFWTWRRPNFGLGALVDRDTGMGGSGKTSEASSIKGTSLYTPLQDAAKSNPNALKEPRLQQAADFYTNLGKAFANAKVALDIVLHTNPHVPQAFLDVATLGRLCETSAGRLVWIDYQPPPEVDDRDAITSWKQAICQELLRPMYVSGWDVIFKVRCSQGWSVRSLLSSVGVLNTASSLTSSDDELELSVVTPETNFAVTLEHRVGGLPKDAELAFVQTALLYTNPWTGDRRIRISTLALRTTNNPQMVLESMDFGALAALQLRVHLPHSNFSSWRSISLSLESNGSSSMADASTPDQRDDHLLSKARLTFVDSCTQALTAYRQHFSKRWAPPMGELVVPQSLELWPLFVMSALKSPLLRPSLPRLGSGTRDAVPSPRGDERAYYLYHARKVSPAAALLLVQPLLLDVGGCIGQSNLTDEEGIFEWENVRPTGSNSSDVMGRLKNCPLVVLPLPMQASVANLAEDGIYLLDTCFSAYVLIERGADDKYKHYKVSLDEKIQNAVQQLKVWSQVGNEPRCLRPTACLPIVTIRQTTDVARYQALLRWMVLDATSHERDFHSFCAELNKRVQMKLSGG